ALPALLASLSSAMLVAAPMVLQWGGGRCPRALDNRVLQWVGERSYGLYLVHQGLAATLIGWFARGGDPRVRFLEQLAIARRSRWRPPRCCSRSSSGRCSPAGSACARRAASR